MRVEEAEKILGCKVHYLNKNNISEALTGIYDCEIYVCKKSFIAFIKDNKIISVYINKEHCSKEILDNFLEVIKSDD